MPTKANVNPKSIQENQLAFKIRKSSRIISYAAESEIETTYEIAKCQVVSLTNIALTGLQTIDGVALAASDLVCVNGQTDATENGIYEVAATAWLRAYDINELYGAGVVGGGWENGTLWALESSNYEVGVDDITFVKIGTLEHSRLIDDEPERHIPTPVRRGAMALSEVITDGMEWIEHLSFIAGSPHGWFQISEADARYDVGAEALVSIADEAAGSVLDTLVEIRRRSAAGIMRLIGLPDALTPDKMLIVDADGNVGTDDLPSGGGLPAGNATYQALVFDTGTDWVPTVNFFVKPGGTVVTINDSAYGTYINNTNNLDALHVRKAGLGWVARFRNNDAGRDGIHVTSGVNGKNLELLGQTPNYPFQFTALLIGYNGSMIRNSLATPRHNGEYREGITPNTQNLVFDKSRTLHRIYGQFPYNVPIALPRRVDDAPDILLPTEGVYHVVAQCLAATEGAGSAPPNSVQNEVIEATVIRSVSGVTVHPHAYPHTDVRTAGLSTPALFSIVPTSVGIVVHFTCPFTTPPYMNVSAAVEVNEMNNNF